MSIFNVLMYRYTAEEDVIVGTLLSSRYRPSLRSLVGPFVNQLPIRTHISEETTFEQLYQMIDETLNEVISHQEVEFNQILQAIVNESGKTNHTPLFQAIFAMDEELQGPNNTKLTPVNIKLNASPYDLIMK